MNDVACFGLSLRQHEWNCAGGAEGLAILTGKRKAPADRFQVNGSKIQRGLPTVSEVDTQNTAQFEALGIQLPTTR